MSTRSRALNSTDLTAIKDAFTTYAVLIFPDQHLYRRIEHLDFAKMFGPLETTIAPYRKDAKLCVRKEFADVFIFDPLYQVLGENSRQRILQFGNWLCIIDSSFRRLSARASPAYARSRSRRSAA